MARDLWLHSADPAAGPPEGIGDQQAEQDLVQAWFAMTDAKAASLETFTPGDIETCFDGERWFNRVHGTLVAANFRATRWEAENKGRSMARARTVGHLVRDDEDVLVSYTRY